MAARHPSFLCKAKHFIHTAKVIVVEATSLILLAWTAFEIIKKKIGF